MGRSAPGLFCQKLTKFAMHKGKQNLVDKERQKIAASASQEAGFIARNAWLNYVLLYGLYPVAAIYSAFTQGSALFVYLDRVINNLLAVTILTIAAAIVIELAKFFLGGAVGEDIRQHVWTESSNHVAAFALKALAFLGFFAFSITLSLTGAPDVAEDYRSAAVPVDGLLIRTDSISNYYDAKIEAERADITAASTMTWKGAIVADGRKIIRAAKANIKDYENQKAAALLDAKAENNQTKAAYEAETATAGNWLTGFAGLGEALALVILLFAGNYRSGAEKEVFAQVGNVTPNAATNASINAMQTNPGQFSQNSTPYQRNPIGFKIPSNASVTNATVSEDEPTNASPNASLNVCNHCGNDYQPKVSWQKFCSEDCRLDHHAEKNGGKRFNPKRYHSKTK
jgi:hypothetical protein